MHTRSSIILASALLVPVLAGLCSPALAQDAAGEPPSSRPEAGGAQSAGLDIVRAAAATLKDAKSLSFRLKTSATGMLVSGTPVVEYSIRMVHASSGVWTVRIEGEGKRRETEQPQQVTALFDDQNVTWVDTALKTVGTKAIRSARGASFQLIYAGRITEIMSSEPLAKEQTAAEAVIESQEDLDGVRCDVVALRARSGLSETRWWFAQSDHLPRKIEKAIKTSAATGTATTEFLDVRLNPPITLADIEIQTPEGFTRNDESAHAGGVTPVHIPSGAPSPTPETPRPESHREQPPSSGEEVAPPPATPDPAAPRRPTVPAHQEAVESTPLDLKITDEQGQAIDLTTLRGKPIVFFVMATWSLPSRSAIDDAEKFRTLLGEQAPMFAVAVQERYPDKAGEFVHARQANLRVIPRGDELAGKLKARVLPAVVIVDRQGLVASSHAAVKPEDWRLIAEDLLAMGVKVELPPIESKEQAGPTPQPEH